MSIQHIIGAAQNDPSSLPRRSALQSVILSALLATGAWQQQAAAGKNRKKRPDKKPANKCKQQGQQCTEFFREFCQQATDPSLCESLVASCCEDLGRCSAAGFLACVAQPVRQP